MKNLNKLATALAEIKEDLELPEANKEGKVTDMERKKTHLLQNIKEYIKDKVATLYQTIEERINYIRMYYNSDGPSTLREIERQAQRSTTQGFPLQDLEAQTPLELLMA